MGVVVEGLREWLFYNKKVTKITIFVIGKIMVKIMVKQWLSSVFQVGVLLFTEKSRDIGCPHIFC